MRKLLYVFIILLCFAVNINANTIYTRADGTAANEEAATDCSAANTSASLANANSWVDVGDTVELCDNGGNFTTAINPSTSPTSEGERITYQEASGDTVVISGTTTQLNLSSGQDYITVSGIEFNDPNSRWLYFNNVTNFIGTNLTFTNLDSGGSFDYRASYLLNSSQLRFTNCSWTGSNVSENATKQFELIQAKDTHYVIFDTCTLIDAAHALFYNYDGESDYIVFRDCVLSNKWRMALEMCGQYNMVESSTFYDIAERGDYNPHVDDRERAASAIYFGGADYSIARKNIVYHSCRGITVATLRNDSKYNRIYNNTIYDMQNFTADGNGGGGFFSEVGVYPYHHNEFINNIFFNLDGDDSGREFRVYKDAPGYITDCLVDNNIIADAGKTVNGQWDTTSGTVSYIDSQEADWGTNFGATTDNPDMTDPDNQDFTLTSVSPCIDTGEWLNTINQASGSAQTITLDLAPYMFYDGWGILGEVGDTIKTENGQTGVIQSINYGAKTITLTAAINIQDNEGIALDYVGNAPDIGAKEFSSPAPGNGIENPTPADEATGQSVDVDISWTNGDDVTKTDFYFDDADCTTEVGADEDAETSYDPGTLNNNDTYYWKVITEPDGANISFPSTGCYTFTTVGTPPDLSGAIYKSYGGARKYNSNAGAWKFVAP